MLVCYNKVRNISEDNLVGVLGTMEEPTISFNELIHPDMEAIAKRDAFLSDENGKKLGEMIDQIHLMEEVNEYIDKVGKCDVR